MCRDVRRGRHATNTHDQAVEEEMMDPLNEVQIASICHEANRAYCLSIGDESQPEWATAPDWQRVSAINGVRFHLTELARWRRAMTV